MARLTHTRAAFKRYMQMAGRTAFIFVEGQDIDPYFYGEVCHPVLSAAKVGYEIVAGWRLADSGGKNVLLGFYDYLAATNSLLTTFQGKRLAAIFFVDKDIDDILNSRKHSDHVVYTQHYGVENYMFVYGDLAHAAASASSLERRDFIAAVGDGSAWRRAIARSWRDWLAFCIFAKKHTINGAANYGRPRSPLNDPIDERPDAAAIRQYRAALQSESGMRTDRFNRSFLAVVRLVDGYHRRGLDDRIFNGKWYARLLEAEIARVAAGRRYNSAHLSRRILPALGTTLDFSAEWADDLRAPLRELIARL